MLGVSHDQIIASGGVINTQCAHILPDSTLYNLDGGVQQSDKKDYSATVLEVLKRFRSTIEELRGEKIHSIYNVMTMEANVHDWFDQLGMWFEATIIPHQYNVKTTNPLFLPPNRITLTTPDSTKLPLPSPGLLAFHAAAAKVAHLSGAGEYIDPILEDIERIGVLSEDGGSGEVLHQALLGGTLIGVGGSVP